ncbi:MAG: hypothetical protein ACJ790_09105 [Myxococcaceae bacterium]
MRAFRFPLALASFAIALAMVVVAACGAEDKEAPRPDTSAAELNACRSFDQLMPTFVSAVHSGKTENLAQVVSKYLVQEGPAGEPAPMPDLLRAIFATLNDFAQLPPERGSAEDQLCVLLPDGGWLDPAPADGGVAPNIGIPPPNRANPICEMRRSMDMLVHKGGAVESIELADPQISGALSYITGQKTDGGQATPHYEVAGVLSGMCQQNQTCQMSDTLDLVIAMTVWLETPEGKASFDRIEKLIKNPQLEPFLTAASNTDAGPALGGETGVRSVAELLLNSILGMQSPSDLDVLVNNPPLSSLDSSDGGLKNDVLAVISDTKLMLDPARSPNILKPLKKVVNCYKVQDSHPDPLKPSALVFDGNAILMLYRLGIVEKRPEFGLTRLIGLVKGLKETDDRGTLVHLAQTIAKAVRADEQAIDSAAKVCHELLNDKAQPGQSQSNAQLALPVVQELATKNLTAEAICTLDTMLYGCAGGGQPACKAADER